MNRALTIFSLAATLAVAPAAGAGQDDGPKRGPRGRHAERLHLPFRGVDLDEGQRQQLRTIAQQYRPQLAALGERLRGARQAQQQAIETLPVNEELIRSRVAALAAIEADAAVLRAKMRAEMFGVLRPEQQQKLAERRAALEKRRAERRERMQQRRQQRQQQRQPAQPQQL